MTELRQVIRLMGTDIPGNKALKIALTNIKGIGANFAQIICHITGFDNNKKAGTLSDQEIKSLETEIKTIDSKLPAWVLNRQNDYESGANRHLFMTDINYIQGNDKTRLGRIKSWRGIRLAARLPVRGQKTRTNFRKKKTVVVRRKK